MLIEVLKPHVRGKGEVRGPEVRTLLGTEQKQEGKCARGRVAKKMGSEGWRGIEELVAVCGFCSE